MRCVAGAMGSVMVVILCEFQPIALCFHDVVQVSATASASGTVHKSHVLVMVHWKWLISRMRAFMRQ